MPSAKRTKLEDVMENVNNAYASQDEVKEKSGNLCTLFEKDGNFFIFSNSVVFMEELNKSLCSSSYCGFYLKVLFLNLLPRSFKSSYLTGKALGGWGRSYI